MQEEWQFWAILDGLYHRVYGRMGLGGGVHLEVSGKKEKKSKTSWGTFPTRHRIVRESTNTTSENRMGDARSSVVRAKETCFERLKRPQKK